MIGRTYVEEIMMIRSAVSIQYRSVMDGWTDRRTDTQTEILYQYRASAIKISKVCLYIFYLGPTYLFNFPVRFCFIDVTVTLFGLLTAPAHTTKSVTTGIIPNNGVRR